VRARVAASVGLATVALVSVAAASSLTVSSGRLTTDTVGTCTATAAADTYVDQSVLAAGSSFGTQQTMAVRSQSLGNRRAFVRFDLAACAIPPTATVTAAELRLALTAAPGTSRTHVLHRATQAWTETTTWNSQAAVAGSATASAGTGTSAGAKVAWASAALTTEVQDWINGSVHHGWRISDAAEGSLLAAAAAYASREHVSAERPELFVTYEP
jgi:hypothetical protein